jgi:hypothetical protein
MCRTPKTFYFVVASVASHVCLFCRHHFHAAVHFYPLFFFLIYLLVYFVIPPLCLKGDGPLSLVPYKRPDRSESTTWKVNIPATRKRGGKSEECKVVCVRGMQMISHFHGSRFLKSLPMWNAYTTKERRGATEPPIFTIIKRKEELKTGSELSKASNGFSCSFL